MRWSNVWTIFRREVRDQVRDRRTLFMIFVLPILLYPVLGIGIARLSVAFEQKPRTVVVLGAEALPESPVLLDAGRDGFDPGLFDSPAEAARLRVRPERAEGMWDDPIGRRVAIRLGEADAVVAIPPDVRAQLEGPRPARIPIYYNSADERSQITYLRVREVLARWNDRIVAARLAREHKPPSYTEPVRAQASDVATPRELGGGVWARVFPFLLVMMALTGAFYPAIDLCAGEKERGTMETLLISPALRGEIVLGKFLTVMLASVVTALLNLASMGLTGLQLARQVGTVAPAGAHRAAAVITPPTPASAAWMVLLLIPLSAFFSAICVALAVLARSMKEGQYYMTPLYLVTLPLIFMTLAPGIELDLFTSLVPITGVSLLLRTLMQGDYGEARRFFLPVLVPTLVYGAIALRWAVDQFQREDVLFREAERFDLRGWVRHLLRDKEPAPTGGQALACFVLMLVSAWFLIQSRFLASSPAGMALAQVGFILTPPLAMAFLLTSDPRRTLRLSWPKGRHLALGVGLGLALNPLVKELGAVVEHLFPIPEAVKAPLEELMRRIPDTGTALLLLAVTPAVCEEVAFRGYILSGFQRGHRIRLAIVLSALMFGFLHVLLSLTQQLFNATLLGLVLGLLAVRSGSLVPGIAFHFLNNALAFVPGHLAGEPVGRRVASWLYRDPGAGLYQWPWVALGGVVSVALLAMLWRGEDPSTGLDRAGVAPDPLAEAG